MFHHASVLLLTSLLFTHLALRIQLTLSLPPPPGNQERESLLVVVIVFEENVNIEVFQISVT